MAITDRYVTPGGTGSYADSTSTGTPSNLATAITNAAGGDWFHLSGTFAETASITFANAGTPTSPIRWTGESTPGGADGYQGRDSTAGDALITTNMPEIAMDGANVFVTCSGRYQIFDSIRFTTANLTTASASLIVGTCDDSSYCGCVVEVTGSGVNGLKALNINGGVYSRIIDCDILLTATSSQRAVILDNYQTIAYCRVSCPDGAAIYNASGTSNCVAYNLVFDSDIGIQSPSGSTGSGRSQYWGNTVVLKSGSTNSCVSQGNGLSDELQVIGQNLLTDAGAYGYKNNYSTALPKIFYRNRWDRHTSGDRLLAGDWPDMYGETSAVTQANEYTDESSGDLSLVSGSPAEDAGVLPSENIGYWQNPGPSTVTALPSIVQASVEILAPTVKNSVDPDIVEASIEILAPTIQTSTAPTIVEASIEILAPTIQIAAPPTVTEASVEILTPIISVAACPDIVEASIQILAPARPSRMKAMQQPRHGLGSGMGY